MSQARLGQLVGRTTATIRAWEADKSTPTDPAVVSVLAAIIGFDERTLFAKAGIDHPVFVETSPTIEEALASLAPDVQTEIIDPVDYQSLSESVAPPGPESIPVSIEEITEPVGKASTEPETTPLFDPMDDEERLHLEELLQEFDDLDELAPEPPDLDEDQTEVITSVRQANAAGSSAASLPTPFIDRQKAVLPALVAMEASYIENPFEKRFYQFRTLATVAGLVLLGIAFLWAVARGMGEFTDWWSNFFEQLRL